MTGTSFVTRVYSLLSYGFVIVSIADTRYRYCSVCVFFKYSTNGHAHFETNWNILDWTYLVPVDAAFNTAKANKQRFIATLAAAMVCVVVWTTQRLRSSLYSSMLMCCK